MLKPKEEPDEPLSRARRSHSSEVVISPSAVAITEWTVHDRADRLIALVVPGATPFDRQSVLKQYSEGAWTRFHPGTLIDANPTATKGWFRAGVLDNLFTRASRLSMPAMEKGLVAPWYPRGTGLWDLLWGLVAIEDWLVEEPLRSMIDQSFYLVHDVHKALWEVRFIAREQPTLDAADVFMGAVIRWLSGETLGEGDRKALAALGIDRLVAENERLGVLLFLFTLAYQNGLLERMVFVFDNLESALHPSERSTLRQLHVLLETGRRWARLGSPVGFLIGFTGSRSDLSLLGKLNSKLAEDVSAGLDWARRSVS
jgi:hypothetical protein